MPRPREDLTGKEINDLVFLSYSHSDRHKTSHWNMKCHCGKTFIGNSASIKKGITRSCGCFMFTHSLSNIPEYRVWLDMKSRCYNVSANCYDNYGGRGISVCDTWKDDFTVFYKDMGPRPSSKHTIERKDNNSNYCKDNCEWATRKQQNRNKRNNILLTYNNETKTIVEWSEILNIHYRTLNNRINRGWSTERALTTAVIKKK